MVDDASWYITVKFLKAKSEAADKIKEYFAYLMARGKTPCALRMDRGTEFVNEDLRTWCNSQGIKFQLTTPYSPSQNGVAERMNHTLVELLWAMLAASELPEFLWEPAVAHAAYVQNLAYMKFLPNMTPYQIWHRRKPNVAHLHKFGAPVWILSQAQHVIWKMLPKSQHHTYVGHDDGSKAIKYYNAVTRNILTLRNLCFLVPSISSPSEELAIEPGMDDPPHEGEPERDTQSVNPIGRAPENDHIDVNAPRKTRGVQVDYRYLNDPFLDKEEAGVSIVHEESYAAVPNDECRSLREAKQSPEWPEWEKAICTKLDQLKKMGTWRLVDKPSGVVAIANKFVFVKKRDKDGRLVKDKA